MTINKAIPEPIETGIGEVIHHSPLNMARCITGPYGENIIAFENRVGMYNILPVIKWWLRKYSPFTPKQYAGFLNWIEDIVRYIGIQFNAWTEGHAILYLGYIVPLPRHDSNTPCYKLVFFTNFYMQGYMNGKVEIIIGLNNPGKDSKERYLTVLESTTETNPASNYWHPFRDFLDAYTFTVNKLLASVIDISQTPEEFQDDARRLCLQLRPMVISIKALAEDPNVDNGNLVNGIVEFAWVQNNKFKNEEEGRRILTDINDSINDRTLWVENKHKPIVTMVPCRQGNIYDKLEDIIPEKDPLIQAESKEKLGSDFINPMSIRYKVYYPSLEFYHLAPQDLTTTLGYVTHSPRLGVYTGKDKKRIVLHPHNPFALVWMPLLHKSALVKGLVSLKGMLESMVGIRRFARIVANNDTENMGAGFLGAVMPLMSPFTDVHGMMSQNNTPPDNIIDSDKSFVDDFMSKLLNPDNGGEHGNGREES